MAATDVKHKLTVTNMRGDICDNICERVVRNRQQQDVTRSRNGRRVRNSHIRQHRADTGARNIGTRTHSSDGVICAQKTGSEDGTYSTSTDHAHAWLNHFSCLSFQSSHEVPDKRTFLLYASLSNQQTIGSCVLSHLKHVEAVDPYGEIP